jgi:hypothetical protein
MTTVAQRAALCQAVSDYLALTKPRITLLVLVTTAAAFWVASKESFSIALFVITLVGTGLASAAAGVLNCLIDRDVDALMARTQGRPLPAGRVHPLSALLFGAVLTVGSFVVLAWGDKSLSCEPRPRGDSLLYFYLHALAQAHLALLHGGRRDRRGSSPGDRLGCGDRGDRSSGAGALWNFILLAAPALLGVGAWAN